MLHSRLAAADFQFSTHLVADDAEIEPKKIRKKRHILKKLFKYYLKW